MKRLVLISLLCLLPFVTFGAFYDGNKLYSMLRICAKLQIENSSSTNDAHQCGIAYGYLMSAADSHTTLVFWDNSSQQFCIPDGVTQNQMGDLVLLYLKSNPAERHKNAASLAMVAFTRAWPCPEE